MSDFYQNITNIYQDKGTTWLKELPIIVEKLAQEWQLTNLIPVANLSYNYVLSGKQLSKPIILKISINESEIAREVISLKAFQDHGGAPILDYTKEAILLDKLTPGLSLKNYKTNNQQEAIDIACKIADKLNKAPLPAGSLFTIEQQLAILDKHWPIEADYLKKARIFRNEILNKYKDLKLLHGDLHRDNILQHGANWLAIDPKAVVGDPIHEVWAFVEDIDMDLTYIAKYFHYNLEDLVKCYFIHVLLAACWAIEDNSNPKIFLELAKKIESKF